MIEPDYKKACIEQEHEITGLLGEALYGISKYGLPMWGDHVAVTLAMVAARRLREMSVLLKTIQSGTLPMHMAQCAAHNLLHGSPTADHTIQDARRYRALRNHSQMMDPRMDGTAVYRVRGIPGRFISFEKAVDSLVEQEDANRRNQASRGNAQEGDVQSPDAD